MCAITESPAGTRVGFVNIKENPPHPYYLYVGDSEDGIVLMDADYDREGALLRKESEQYWLYMRGDGAAPPPAAPQAPRALAPRAAPPVGTSRPSGPGNSGGSSYAARRQQRLEEMRQRAAKARKASEADVEKRLQEYQMDLIRKGLTPLPIPLTEEMDKQLVEEGLLPAVEAME